MSKREDIKELQSKVDRLYSRLYELWDKHNRLLTYLQLDDYVEPEKKIIKELGDKSHE